MSFLIRSISIISSPAFTETAGAVNFTSDGAETLDVATGAVVLAAETLAPDFLVSRYAKISFLVTLPSEPVPVIESNSA